MADAYLSALGMMGRRHLKGLIRAGFKVHASEPNPEAFAIARAELLQSGLPAEHLMSADSPPGSMHLAIFAETTTRRLENFTRLLETAQVGRVLLEKPISADPGEFDKFMMFAREKGIADRTQVNFIRRTWPHVRQLSDMCREEKEFTVTLNGGAIGLGCNGIHYLDTFLSFSGDEVPEVQWASLSKESVKSGRGAQYEDYGGDFVLVGARGRMLASLSAASSAGVVMTVRGEHFMAQVDYSDLQWKIVRRKQGSTLPYYRYGAEYEMVEQGKLDIPPMDMVTEHWALEKLSLPTLEQALATHRLLDAVLRAGGAQPPYRFT